MDKKIVVIGPESTGKSYLCSELAAKYQTSWCPEYAREFLSTRNGNYSYEDLLDIAKGQLQLEDLHIQAIQEREVESDNRYLFIDTNMYVMKVWCEFVFGNCHSYILKQIAIRPYDLYLLCDVDLPWVKDELREYPNLDIRQKLFKMYFECMTSQQVPWTIISGNYSERLLKAIAAIESLK